MDKAQALDAFWNSFGIPAYDENTVPEDVKMPYITYNVVEDSLDTVVNLYASLWYHTTSWKEITQKADEIGEAIVKMYPPAIKIDSGRLYLSKGTPFAQRMTDTASDSVRRIYLNIQAEFLTAF